MISQIHFLNHCDIVIFVITNTYFVFVPIPGAELLKSLEPCIVACQKAVFYYASEVIWETSRCGTDGKESACNAGDTGSIPGSERSLGEEMATHSSILGWKIPWMEKTGGLWPPTPVFLAGKSHGWRRLAGYGHPLQYSWLENPMDGEDWRATVHTVAKSQTRLNS